MVVTHGSSARAGRVQMLPDATSGGVVGKLHLQIFCMSATSLASPNYVVLKELGTCHVVAFGKMTCITLIHRKNPLRFVCWSVFKGCTVKD